MAGKEARRAPRAGPAPRRGTARRGTARLVVGDARAMPEVGDGAAALVVTSPPYPMIAMWDEPFGTLGARSYAEMHEVLDGVWRECARALMPGGIACVVVGDALRTVDHRFRLFPNHARVLSAFEALGFDVLPYILWKKPTNKPNAFLGSGFLPPNAYVTLDCEFILLLRKGGLRKFASGDARRRDAAYTKEERDLWFSQVWELKGARQGRGGGGRRSAAFPPEIPRRLVRMFSVEGDLVLDPFAGTGTTLAAACALGRHALGYEIDASLAPEAQRAVAAAGGRLAVVRPGARGAARPKR